MSGSSELPLAANRILNDYERGFYGVRLSIEPADEGLWDYVITKAHENAYESIVLGRYKDDSCVIAHWRRWADKLQLPLCVEREAGHTTQLETLIGQVKIGPRAPLRRVQRFGARRSPRRRMRRFGAWRPTIKRAG